jgi:hypothetical protein
MFALMLPMRSSWVSPGAMVITGLVCPFTVRCVGRAAVDAGRHLAVGPDLDVLQQHHALLDAREFRHGLQQPLDHQPAGEAAHHLLLRAAVLWL